MVMDVARVFISDERLKDFDSPHTEFDICTALSRSGVCVYLESLRSLSAQADSVRRVHVLPGHIQRDTQRYEDVWDPSFLSLKPQSNLEEAQFKVEVDVLKFQVSESLHCHPPVEQSSDHRGWVHQRAIFYYQISTPGGAWLSSPGAITNLVLRGSGMVVCNQNTCKDQLAFQGMASKQKSGRSALKTGGNSMLRLDWSRRGFSMLCRGAERWQRFKAV